MSRGVKLVVGLGDWGFGDGGGQGGLEVALGKGEEGGQEGGEAGGEKGRIVDWIGLSIYLMF